MSVLPSRAVEHDDGRRAADLDAPGVAPGGLEGHGPQGGPDAGGGHGPRLRWPAPAGAERGVAVQAVGAGHCARLPGARTVQTRGSVTGVSSMGSPSLAAVQAVTRSQSVQRPTASRTVGRMWAGLV